MLGHLLPSGFSVAEEFGDPPGIRLFPAERDVVRNATERGRREFTTVRGCARRALTAIGVAPVAILPGHGGAPQWPGGVVGSMTHCEGYRAAAVARDTDASSAGIDAEPHEPLPQGLLRRLTSGDEERAQLRELAESQPAVCWDRLLFSAKEAVYKAWYPLTGRPLGFRRATVELLAPGDESGAETDTGPGWDVRGDLSQALSGDVRGGVGDDSGGDAGAGGGRPYGVVYGGSPESPCGGSRAAAVDRASAEVGRGPYAEMYGGREKGRLTARSGSFTATLRVPDHPSGCPRTFRGRWAASAELLTTAVVVLDAR